MSIDDQTLSEEAAVPEPLELEPTTAPQRRNRRGRLRFGRRSDRPPRPKVRKLRLFFVLAGFLGLALIATVFGMLTAVASDLPELENAQQYASSVDSYLVDAQGHPIGDLAPPGSHVNVTWDQLKVNPNMVNAIVAIEDHNFWHSSGIDIRSIGRALLSDLSGGPTQGASTIPEEFVKNVLAEEDNRTIFEKLREAGLAFQLVQKWKKRTIITEYLNAIYFGNGANGVEAAARTYFGKNYGYNAGASGSAADSGCGSADAEGAQGRARKACVEMLDPAQAALLAGMVANPTAFNPILHPEAARARRDQVLSDMYAQHYISRVQYERARDEILPQPSDIQQPQEPESAPYYVAWVRPLVIRALRHEGLSPAQAQYEAYYGGLRIKLSLNLSMQQAAQQAINQEFPPGSGGPTASLVAIDNSNGEVRAMVSGDGDYQQSPFNLATLGYRQPGSSFKLFTLAAALKEGKASADSIFDSKPIAIPFETPEHYRAEFHVHNFGNEYQGPISLATATTTSDNSVFAQLGMEVGTRRIRAMAQAMGIRSPISTTPAMILGGLQTGVSALDMAHAYETVATGGKKIYNKTLGDYNEGPIGIQSISGCKPCRDHTITNNHPQAKQVLSPAVADEIHSLLLGPVSSAGTAPDAAIPGVDVAGKTGTTSNYVDAWFVGWTPEMTVAVWVGYPNNATPMTTTFYGKPVEGGTFPAIIFHNFMVQALAILQAEAAHHAIGTVTGQQYPTTYGSTTTPSQSTSATTTTTPTSNTTATTPATGNTTTTPAGTGGATGGSGGATGGTGGTGGETGGTGGTTGGTNGGTGGTGGTGGATGGGTGASGGSGL